MNIYLLSIILSSYSMIIDPNTGYLVVKSMVKTVAHDAIEKAAESTETVRENLAHDTEQQIHHGYDKSRRIISQIYHRLKSTLTGSTSTDNTANIESDQINTAARILQTMSKPSVQTDNTNDQQPSRSKARGEFRYSANTSANNLQRSNILPNVSKPSVQTDNTNDQQPSISKARGEFRYSANTSANNLQRSNSAPTRISQDKPAEPQKPSETVIAITEGAGRLMDSKHIKGLKFLKLAWDYLLKYILSLIVISIISATVTTFVMYSLSLAGIKQITAYTGPSKEAIAHAVVAELTPELYAITNAIAVALLKNITKVLQNTSN